MNNKLRFAIFDRAANLCEVCHSPGDWRRLAIHHKVMRSKGGKDEMNNLILLCGKCHSERHRIRER
jgi:5-methylcytosine-specific restriction endonuclease McrA